MDSHFLNEPNGFDMSRIIAGLRDLTRETADKPLGVSLKAAPVIGQVTATYATSVQLKAGASELSSRSWMRVRNLSPYLVKIGPSSVNALYEDGIAIDPDATIEIKFDPDTAVSIYARSMGGAATLEVIEG